ncbi:unnamed protein product [Clavelina lepadiformis]|uniref:Glutamyl-tRNA(Gln) amidotransferase subunit A, mitochondrial n=1 Tax=Clavelina lepadiformis TaxID=159417 RepID=A0ABP0F3E1_CLALP
MSSTDILMKPLVSVLQMLRNRVISTEELLHRTYTRINETKSLNAFVSVVEKNDNLEFCIKDDRSSILKGIPFAVKDNFSTRNISTTCASNMLRNYVPTYSATVVKKLTDAGGTLMGKTNLDEFAMGVGTVDSIIGPTRNPWQYDFQHPNPDDWYIAGGSSGGSAVAVATGASYFALGSDTGGSVRLPASFCGVVGLKPTYGSLSRHGLISLVNSMDVPGILARCVDDVVFIYNILSGNDPRDSTTVQGKVEKVVIEENPSVKDLVVGIPKQYHGPDVSPEIIDCWKWAADIFSNNGAKVVEVSLPHTQYSIVCYHVLCCGEVASNMARYDGLQYGHRSDGGFTEEMYAKSRNEGFNESVRGRITAGNYFLLRRNYRKYYEKAQKVRRLIQTDIKKVFDKGSGKNSGVDVLLAPVTVSTAPQYKTFAQKTNSYRTVEHDIYTQSANMAGVPAISVPVRLSQAKLPISLQLLASNFNEGTLLRAAKFLENASSFQHPKFDF